MWWLSSLRPSCREWLAAGLLFLLVPIVAHYGRNLILPPAVPMTAEVVRDGMQSDGTWLVERTLTRTVACRMIVYDRRFDGEASGQSVDNLRVPAVASSFPDILEPTVAAKNSAPGANTAWWAYRLPPGFRGLFTVRVGVDGCENGFSGWFVLYTATVP